MKIIRFILFNAFTRGQLKRSVRTNFLGRRYGTMTTDLSYMTSLFFIPFLLLVVPFIINSIITHATPSDSMNYLDIIGPMFFIVMLFILINKDMCNGKSIAKRIFGYQIIDIETYDVASPVKCALRNITFLIWPLEAVILLFNPRRRLGDFIAGTKLIDVPTEEAESILEDMQNSESYSNFTSAIFISILITLFLVGMAWYLHNINLPR